MLTSPTPTPPAASAAQAAGSQADPLASQGSLASLRRAECCSPSTPAAIGVSLFRVARGDKLMLKQITASGGLPGEHRCARRPRLRAERRPRGRQQLACRATGWPATTSGRSPGRTARSAPTDTTPPFFLASPGMVGFSPDGRRLIVTTKFSGSLIDVFSVGPWGKLSSTPTANQGSSATPVPFAFSFDRLGPAGHLSRWAAPASAATASTPTTASPIIGSADDTTHSVAASCWISTAAGYYFVSNAGSANLSTYMLDASGVPSLVGMCRSWLRPAPPTRWRRVTVASFTCGAAAPASCSPTVSITMAASGLIQTVTGLPMPAPVAPFSWGVRRDRPQLNPGARRCGGPYGRAAAVLRPRSRAPRCRHLGQLQVPQGRKVVSERLGQATVSITLDTYSHAIPAMQEEAATLIAGLVFATD